MNFLAALTLALAHPVPGTIAWAPSPQIAFGAFGTNGIYTINRDGSGLRQVTKVGSGDTPLRFSPDGRTLLLSDKVKMYSIGVDGSGLRPLGPGYIGSWSPDGKLIAVVRNAGYFLMRANGSGVRELAPNRYPDSPPAWSPDGERLAYTACTAPFLSRPCEHMFGFDVYTRAVNGSGKQRVTPKSGNPGCVNWSSKGRLAFYLGNAHSAIVLPNGQLKTFLGNGCPIWSPDGSRLAILSAKGVVLVNASGGGRHELPVRPDLNDGFLDVTWSPDGRYLAVLSVLRKGSRNALFVVPAAGGTAKRIA